jgi:hypothetical protein
MIHRPDGLPESNAAAWDTIRALDVSEVSGPLVVAEAVASHPRVEAVFGLDVAAFRALLGSAPDLGLRHVELAPGILPMPIAAFDRESTLPRLTRIALAADVGPLFVPWLLTSAVGRRLTHVAFGLDRKDLSEILSVLKDFGANVQHVALLRPEGSRVVPVDMFTAVRRPSAYVPWCRLVREGDAFSVTEVESGGAFAPVFDALVDTEGELPPVYVPRALAPARTRPVFEPWNAPDPRPGVSPMNEETFWGLLDRARAAAHRRIDEDFARAVVADLASRDLESIVSFRDRLDLFVAKSHTLDLRIAHYLATGVWSDDGFLSFVHWLVARGREAYMRVVGEPDALADVVPDEVVTPHDACALSFESLMHSATRAYEQRTQRADEGMPARPGPSPDPARGRNTSPPVLDAIDLQRRFPGIWTRFRSEKAGS